MTTLTSGDYIRKEAILNALSAWIRQRPGLDPSNYGHNWPAYRSEVRRITRQRHDAMALLRFVAIRDSITAECLTDAFRGAYSGRLSMRDQGDGTVVLDYVTGQYWPTEYRAAACAVLAQAVWYYLTGCFRNQHGTSEGAGDYARKAARGEFGRGLASRWLD